MTTSRHHQAAVDQIGSAFIKLGTENHEQLNTLNERWQAWVKRFDIYADADKNNYDKNFSRFESFNQWLENDKFSLQSAKLKEVLLALSELQANKESFSNAAQLENILIKRIHIELSKLELAQAKTLQRLQELPRDYAHSKATFRADRREFHTSIKTAELKTALNETLKIRDDNKNGMENLTIFLNRHVSISKRIQRKIHHLDGDKLSAVGNVSLTGSQLLATILHSALHFARAVGNVLVAIPVVSAVGTAVPLVFRAINTWRKKQPPAKRAVATALAIIAIGVAATSGFGVIAAAGAAAGLIAVGVFIDSVLPWIQVRNQIKEHEKELKLIEERKTTLNNDVSDLELREKHFLLRKLEDSWLAKQIDEDSLKIAKNAVLEGKTEKIKPLLADGVFGDDIKTTRLEAFLQTEGEKKTAFLNDNLGDLRKLEKKKFWEMLNGCLAIAGSLLVCIPTPPTAFVGGALLLTNAVVGVAIKYQLVDKFINFAKNIFGNKKKEEVVVVADNEKEKEKEKIIDGLALEHEALHEKQKVIHNSMTDIRHGLHLNGTQGTHFDMEEEKQTIAHQADHVISKPSEPEAKKTHEDDEGEKEHPHPG